MNSYLKKIMICSGLLVGAASLNAQTTYSGYFLDNYDYRFQMNPAFGNEKGFVSFPTLGNLNFNMHGNLHVSDVVYSLNGKTVLFTNPGISTSEAMSRIHDKNRPTKSTFFLLASRLLEATTRFHSAQLPTPTSLCRERSSRLQKRV